MDSEHFLQRQLHQAEYSARRPARGVNPILISTGCTSSSSTSSITLTSLRIVLFTALFPILTPLTLPTPLPLPVTVPRITITHAVLQIFFTYVPSAFIPWISNPSHNLNVAKHEPKSCRSVHLQPSPILDQGIFTSQEHCHDHTISPFSPLVPAAIGPFKVVTQVFLTCFDGVKTLF